MLRQLALLALALGGFGCFVEAAASAYGVRAEETAPFAGSYSIAVGFYLDPGPVRVALGGGGDLLHVARDDDEPPTVHVGGGSYLRLDATLFERRWLWRLTAVATPYPGGVSFDPEGDAPRETIGRGGSGFLGLTFARYVSSNFGFHVSLGPTTLVSRAPGLGTLWATGGQLRLTVSFKLGGMGALFRAGYDADAARRGWERDQRYQNTQREGLIEQRQEQEQRDREQRERERRGY